MQTTQELRTIIDVMGANEKRLGTINEATAELSALMSAVRATGKKGTLTIKFEVAPDKNDELALTINADVSCTKPKPERRKALIYHDAESQTFSRSDPRQMELLAEQEAEKAERKRSMDEANIAMIGRGAQVVHATGG